MTSKERKYRQAFKTIHSTSLNQSIISIRRAIRKDFQRLSAQNLTQIELLVLKETKKAYLDRFKKTGLRWGNVIYNQLGEQKRFNPVFSRAWALFILQNSEEFISKQIRTIGETAKKEVKESVKQNIEIGDDVTDLTNEIKKVVNSNTFYLWQAERIARTETTTAMNTASDVAANETKRPFKKEWLTAGDGRERQSHMRLNGQKVSKGQRFENGLLYPGDPSGSASEIINCRCATLYIPVV